MDKNVVYQWLSSPTPQNPAAQQQQSNNSMLEFYNDEVMSHLHGYMLLVGTLALQDNVFLISFLPYAILAAAATYFEYLPANPRVPAIVAVATLATCAATGALQVPDDAKWIGGVCAANIVWGFWGPWKNSLREE